MLEALLITQMREHSKRAQEGTDVRWNERHLRWKFDELDALLQFVDSPAQLVKLFEGLAKMVGWKIETDWQDESDGVDTYTLYVWRKVNHD